MYVRWQSGNHLTAADNSGATTPPDTASRSVLAGAVVVNGATPNIPRVVGAWVVPRRALKGGAAILSAHVVVEADAGVGVPATGASTADSREDGGGEGKGRQ